MKKVYVETLVRFLESGGMRPKLLIWTNGKVYRIDRVAKIERAPACVGSLLPMRYTCIFGVKSRYLYYEEENKRWFVEHEDDPAQRSE